MGRSPPSDRRPDCPRPGALPAIPRIPLRGGTLDRAAARPTCRAPRGGGDAGLRLVPGRRAHAGAVDADAGSTALPLPVLTAPRADRAQGRPPASRVPTRPDPRGIEPCVCGQTSRASPAASNARSRAIPARRRAERRRCPPSPRGPGRSRRRPGPVGGVGRRRAPRLAAVDTLGARPSDDGVQPARGELPAFRCRLLGGPDDEAAPPRFTASRAPRANWPPSRRSPRGGWAGPSLAPRCPGHQIEQSESQVATARPLASIPATGAMAPLQFGSSARCRRSAAHRPTGPAPGWAPEVSSDPSLRTPPQRDRRAATEARSQERRRPGRGPAHSASSYLMSITITGPHAVSRMLPMA